MRFVFQYASNKSHCQNISVREFGNEVITRRMFEASISFASNRNKINGEQMHNWRVANGIDSDEEMDLMLDDVDKEVQENPVTGIFHLQWRHHPLPRSPFLGTSSLQNRADCRVVVVIFFFLRLARRRLGWHSTPVRILDSSTAASGRRWSGRQGTDRGRLPAKWFRCREIVCNA